jgi:hypothetical protein
LTIKPLNEGEYTLSVKLQDEDNNIAIYALDIEIVYETLRENVNVKAEKI